MFRFMVISLAVTASVLAEDGCDKFFHPGVIMKCCKETPSISPDFMAIYKECYDLPHENSCERDLCLATKKGFALPDGKLLLDAIKEKLEKDKEKLPILATEMIKHCVDESISKFGSPDTCDATKFMRCTELQIAKTCPDWSNDGPCEGLKDLSAECKKKYN